MVDVRRWLPTGATLRRRWKERLGFIKCDRPQREFNMTQSGPFERDEHFVLTLELSGRRLVPAQITKRLGVKPSESCKSKNPDAPNPTETDLGRWIYWCSGDDKEPLESLLQKLFADFQPREDELIKLTREFDAELTIKFNWNEGDYMAPNIKLSRETMKKLCELNLALEVSTEMSYADDGSWEDDSLDDDDDDFYRRRRR